MTQTAIRNIAIIAHVDHGKTTLVDQLLRQSGTFRTNQVVAERVMDSNDIERERGITILAKNCAVEYEGTRINIVDTPGHADFGGEVERALSMVDCVLLLVDAVEGPMPQTRFVTRKALALGLKPIVVVNKVDRPGARPHWVVDQTFDLFDKLGATEAQLDFTVVYCSALNGWATRELDQPSTVMKPLFDTILEKAPQREDDIEGPLQLQISSIDYSSYVGRIGVGRINRGRVKTNQEAVIVHGPNGPTKNVKIGQVLQYAGLERERVEYAEAGDIIAITGVEGVEIGSTVCAKDTPEGLPLLAIDEPTMTMEFMVNDSPLAGREGKFVTSRQIRERLEKELQANVALRVEFGDDTEAFKVWGRGELHLTILLENMRREGYELAVSRPKPLIKMIDDVKNEPFEILAVDVEDNHQGTVMEMLGQRKGELVNMVPDGKGRTRMDYRIPARGLIGFHSEFLGSTRGTGIASSSFDAFRPWAGDITERRNGVLISQYDGEVVTYALGKLQDRGRMFVKAGDPLYEGMIVGIHTRDNDLIVNANRAKQLTNFRVSGKEDTIVLTPAIELSLEKAVEFIADDELVELTPKSIRLRKRHLKEHDRKKAMREEAA